MKIEITDIPKFEKNQAFYGVKFTKNIYAVFAILKSKKTLYYLTYGFGELTLWKSDAFLIIDDSIPSDWVELNFNRFYKIYSKDGLSSIRLSYYNGPKEFLDNDLFFQIDEDAYYAYELFIQYHKKRIKNIEQGK